MPAPRTFGPSKLSLDAARLLCAVVLGHTSGTRHAAALLGFTQSYAGRLVQELRNAGLLQEEKGIEE